MDYDENGLYEKSEKLSRMDRKRNDVEKKGVGKKQ